MRDVNQPRSLGLAIGLALLVLAVTGCYKLHPVTTTEVPAVGVRVTVEINDIGRVALGGSMGPEIDRIEGRMEAKDSAGYLIAVQQVYLVRGGMQVWSGELIRLGKDQVRSFSERQFSKGRSIALGAVGVGGVAFMLSRGLLGAGLGEPPRVPTDSGASLRVIWP